MRASLTTIILITCALLSACTQWRWDMGMSLADDAVPEKGTPLGAVLLQLGPPMRLSSSDNGYLMAWEYWHIREDSVGIRLGALGAEFLSADWGEMRVKGNFLLLSFDEQHRLSAAVRSEWDNYGGGGKGIQPLFGFVSVVDADDLTAPMPQHEWGLGLLQRRLPVALNRNSNPDMGQGGLQQRGTPGAAGQRALEMH